MRKESCTGPYTNIALMWKSWCRIITLNLVEKFDGQIRGHRDVVGDPWTYVHSVVVRVVQVQTGYNCVDLLRADNGLDPLHLHYVVHVGLPLNVRSPVVPLCPSAVDHHTDPSYRHLNDSSVIASTVPYDTVPFLANEFVLKLAMLDHHHDHLLNTHVERSLSSYHSWMSFHC